VSAFPHSRRRSSAERDRDGVCEASTAIRERRRTLRYRNLLVRQMVQMKNKIGMLLMEAGVS
jgi:hypothetical protein